MGVAPSFSKPLGLADAADFLDGMPHITQINQPGVLLLADGGRFEGQLFGAAAIGEGELVFTTGIYCCQHVHLLGHSLIRKKTKKKPAWSQAHEDTIKKKKKK